ncbi:hypothetical protein ACI48D_19980 [Massilia sp. LXY-6]|uniref:hypothetical protein n=1 Tax=Massilia sp. LXY-6 TaxID=3379823 RepID=UPI003EE18407
MFTMKPRRMSQMTISLAMLSALGACGGGGNDPPTPPVSGPEAPTPATPTPPAPPAPPTTPTPPTPPAPPPTDPAPPPPPELHLAPGYTEVQAVEALSTPYWSDWSYTGTAPIDGVACASSEAYHIHAMISIYRNGMRLALPKNIGRRACHYDMHTHDGTGVIHVETAVPKVFTLGQFFSLWGQTLSPAEVAGLPGAPTFYVVQNERITKITQNPDDITLEAHKEIVIVTGTPPAELLRFHWSTSGL